MLSVKQVATDPGLGEGPGRPRVHPINPVLAARPEGQTGG